MMIVVILYYEPDREKLRLSHGEAERKTRELIVSHERIRAAVALPCRRTRKPSYM